MHIRLSTFLLPCFFSVSCIGLLLRAENAVDLGEFKKDAQIFESIMAERLKQNFPNPFSLSGEPKSAYLRDYGVVINFNLNINRASIRWPWGQLSPPPGVTHGEPPKKRDQIRLVKETVVQCLANYGDTIKQLRPGDRISIYAHVEDRNELDPTRSMTVLVFTVTKSDVENFSMQRISLGEFNRKVSIAEY